MEEILKDIAGSLRSIAQTLQGIEAELSMTRQQSPDSPERREAEYKAGLRGMAAYYGITEEELVAEIMKPFHRPEPPVPPWLRGE